MDEVFGNSSSDTVVEANWSQVLDHINKDIEDLNQLESQLQNEDQHQNEESNSQVSTQESKCIPKPPATRPEPPSYAQTMNNLHSASRSQLPSFYSISTVAPQGTSSVTAAHVPVITSVIKTREPEPAPRVSKLSQSKLAPSPALRHTQSTVVPRVNTSAGQTPRPRSHSTGDTSQYQQPAQQPRTNSTGDASHYHLPTHQPLVYPFTEKRKNLIQQQQISSHNVPQNSHKLSQVRPVSQYDNLPLYNSSLQTLQIPAPLPVMCSFNHIDPKSHQRNPNPPYVNLPCYSGKPVNTPNIVLEVPSTPPPTPPPSSGSSSAPSTPHGPNGFRHSYIEIWTGVKEERDSLSDSECDELRRNTSYLEPSTPTGRRSPGYVEMSSPYFKSPQPESSPFNGSVLADLATKLASYAGHVPRNIFCPLCPRYFGYEKSLSSHIHKYHRDMLNGMIDGKPGDVQLQYCPICQARFFNMSVLPKHLVDFHRASVVEILEKNDCILSDASGIQCPFCAKKVPHGKTGEQVLLYHMQQAHMVDFEEMVQRKFRSYSAGRDSLKSISSGDVSQLLSFTPGVTSTPGLSNKMIGLSMEAKRSVEALNLDETWTSHKGIIKTPITSPVPELKPRLDQDYHRHIPSQVKTTQLPMSPSKGILRQHSSTGNKQSVKRELRFSVPPVTSEEFYVPESPESSDHSTPERETPNLREASQNLNPTSQQQIHIPQYQKREAGSTPYKVNVLKQADFMELTTKSAGRKRRRLGLGLKSRKAFKKKDKENISENELKGSTMKFVKDITQPNKVIQNFTQPTKVIETNKTRTFRRPKPVPIPSVPDHPFTSQPEEQSQPPEIEAMEAQGDSSGENSPFGNLKLYSPLRMFRCNSCHVKFCDNDSLSGHIGARHRGLLGLLRPQYGCGVCSAKFYENKYLVKHCLQHHTSLLEIRSPKRHKITIYRFSHD